MTMATSLSGIVATDSGVAAGYRHVPKHVTPGEPLETAGAVLKWYGLHPFDRPIPTELERLARAYLVRARLAARGMGFVVLHRCGEDFYFLLVATWRGTNELWETVFYKDSEAMADFAL